MELVGQLWNFKYSKTYLAGAGIQTAALAFGGYTPQLLQEQQNYMMVQVGQRYSTMATARSIRRSRNKQQL
jgi:hypothetical protein